MDKETIEQLRKGHPDFMSPKDAAPFLGMSARKLSELVAEGRAPYHQLGGNIGATKRIVFIYTERLMEWQVKSNKAISELRVLVAGMGLLFYKNVIVYFLMVSFPSPQEWRTLYENPA